MRPMNGLRLGSIAGIDIAVDWSLLIVFLLVTFSLAAGVFPVWHPGWSAALAWGTAAAAALLLFASVLVHELSHAIVGRACGVRFSRITLFVFGGMAQMENEPPNWRAEFAMAIVGPLTSLALGVSSLALAALLVGPLEIDPADPRQALARLGPLATLLLWLGPVNVVLAVFNLVPGFPLDGGRVLRAVMWGISGNLRRATRWASLAGQAFAWLLMATGVLIILGLRLPVIGGSIVGGLWLAFIGWFLNNAAIAGYRQLLLRESLENVTVRDLMQTRYTSVDPRLPVAALVDVHLMASGQRAFPVEDDGLLVGLVSLRDVQKCDRADWIDTPVARIMTPVGELVTVSPEQVAIDALALLAQRDLNQLPVVRAGRLVGLLRREDILKWLAIHADGELAGRNSHDHRPARR